VRFLRRRFLQDGDPPFSSCLSEATIAPALESIDVLWKDRVFSPLVTLWVFLSQVLSADHSCRAAVARLIAHRLSEGEPVCSANTGAYCQARKRLPEKFFSAVARLVGCSLDTKADPRWLWKGRRIYMFDGTTVTMPDTPENQAAYPQVQKSGIGFLGNGWLGYVARYPNRSNLIARLSTDQGPINSGRAAFGRDLLMHLQLADGARFNRPVVRDPGS
jgi:hypothetical protein